VYVKEIHYNAWTGLIWLRMGTHIGLLLSWKWNSGSIQRGENLE